MPSEILDFAIGTIIGNISTAVVLTLVYYNFILFEDYVRVIIWAFLFSQALRGAKEKICRLLRYLSRGKEIQRDGLLYTVWTQALPYFLRGPHLDDVGGGGGDAMPTDHGHHPAPQNRATMLILDNGIFIFAWISGVSIYVRMFSLVSFLQLTVATLAIGSLIVWVLDRRVFYYRYFVTDDVLVSMLLIGGCFVIGFFVLIYLGTESYMEGSLAAAHVSRWIQKNVINDERARTVWGEQMATGKAMVASALAGIEGSYNNTMWFAPLKTMAASYYDGPPDQHQSVAFALPGNMTWVEAWSLAYAQFSDFNLTSVEVSDLTSKGLEYSGLAVGSVVQLVFVLVAFVVAFVSIGLKAFFFVTSLFYLLSAKWDPIERIVHDLIPIAPEKRPAMVVSLRRAIEGVFFLPMKISSLHAIVSLVSFSVVRTDFVFLGTLMTFFISIVPIVPPYLICLPYVFLRLSTSFVTAIMLFVVHYVAFSWIDQVLYERSLTSINAYISALSVAFGVYVFGLEGVVFGPLLVCGVNWAYEISNQGIQAATSDEEMSSAAASPLSNSSSTKDSIFSSAYKAISGSFRGNLRRLSFDASDEKSICIDLEVHGADHDVPPYVVRYIAHKDWTYDQLLKHMRQTLKVWNVRGLYAKKTNAQILSAAHLFPKELIKVVVQEEPSSSSPDEADLSTTLRLRPPTHQYRHRQPKSKLKLSPGSRRPTIMVTPPRSRRSSYSASPRQSFRWSESGGSNLGDDVAADDNMDSFHSAIQGNLESPTSDTSHGKSSDGEMLSSPKKKKKKDVQESIQPPTSPIHLRAHLRRRGRSHSASPDAKKAPPKHEDDTEDPPQGLWKSLFKPA
ncbi:Aste57867_9424 [Aphanomyces stellatus]|uniref:Aste57867_9424 protein n=1 Tax=Aphanomyces stellatus TaxID=120398 RepID=A0A485KN80_9STRA|nr:hypothetical protein As57867_009388 [Aphanomyces stellatus]VFT86304.1 Aste57867_9424 [Aphanomyces stellatus]